MNKLEQTRKRGTNTLIALAIIAVAVYVGFTPLYELINGGVAGAVIGASFGAIFVIILTMYLLNKQTEIEQESKKSERVFDEKVKLYYEIYNEIESMLKDGQISKDMEMKKLPFAMARLITIASDEVIKSFTEIFTLIVGIYSKEAEQDQVLIHPADEQKLLERLLNFAKSCRMDLGISDVPIDTELMKLAVQEVEQSSKLVSIRGKEILPDTSPEHSHAFADMPDGQYKIVRYKNAAIRIYKDNEYLEVVVKDELKKINTELDLQIDERDWGNTQKAGYTIIKAIKNRKKEI
tara:strand:+ start:1188 stop:2066 length:879 start_codon:yes stop_codon:yes gene_type:complete